MKHLKCTGPWDNMFSVYNKFRMWLSVCLTLCLSVCLHLRAHRCSPAVLVWKFITSWWNNVEIFSGMMDCWTGLNQFAGKRLHSHLYAANQVQDKHSHDRRQHKEYPKYYANDHQFCEILSREICFIKYWIQIQIGGHFTHFCSGFKMVRLWTFYGLCNSSDMPALSVCQKSFFFPKFYNQKIRLKQWFFYL